MTVDTMRCGPKLPFANRARQLSQKSLGRFKGGVCRRVSRGHGSSGRVAAANRSRAHVNTSYVEMYRGSLQEKELFMKAVLNSARRLLNDEQGMETVEWGVMAALIVAALVTAISTLGGNVLAKFNQLVTATQ